MRRSCLSAIAIRELGMQRIVHKADGASTSVGMVIASVAVLLILASLDQTIVAMALPTIVSDLGGVDQLGWVVAANLLTATIVAPIYGKLGDLYGRRIVVAVAISLFLVGAFAAGMAGNMAFLILARSIQGLGGGGLLVLAFSIIGDLVAPKERGRVQGLFGGAFALSSVAGPLLGGWLVDALSWRWIFWINLPLGLAALAGFVFGFRARPDRVSHRIDVPGAILLMVTLSALALFSSLGGKALAWSSPEIIGTVALALVGLVGFVFIEMRAEEPILSPDMFRINAFCVFAAGSFVLGFILFGAVTFLPLYLQVAKGISPTASGAHLLPMMLATTIGSAATGHLLTRTGRYKFMLISGMAVTSIGVLAVSMMASDTANLLFGVFTLIAGFGIGIIFPVLMTGIQNAVPHSQLGAATAASLMFRQIGGMLGVAICSAVYSSGLVTRLPKLPGDGVNVNEIGPQMLSTIPSELRGLVADAVAQSLHPVFQIMVGIAVLGLLIAFLLRQTPLFEKNEAVETNS